MRCWLLVLVLLMGVSRPGWVQDSLSHTPVVGQVVSATRPVISVQVARGGQLPYEGARMWVNGKEVTGQCLKTPMFVSYQSPDDMGDGPVQVKFTAGNSTLNWDFTIRHKASILSVTHDAQSGLNEYDDLKVTLLGEPGGRAWFAVDGLVDNVPMEEGEAGTYQGTYNVKPGDHRLGGHVTGYLRLGQKVDHKDADHPISIFADLFRVKIFEPASGTHVPLTFSIKGRTRPRAKVVAAPVLALNNNQPAPATLNGTTRGGGNTIEGKADDQGFFSITYGVPLSLPNLHVVMQVFAVDEDGNRSVPVTLRYWF